MILLLVNISLTTIVFIGVALMLCLLFTTLFILLSENKDTVNMRIEQYKKKRSIALNNKMERNLKRNVKNTPRYKIETLCLQSGLNIDYGKYMLMCLTTAILLPVIALQLLKNPFIAFPSIFLGWKLPSQLLGLLRNARLNRIESQIGSFINLLTERYKALKDLPRSIIETVDDFQGQEPITTEINLTISEMETNETPINALKNMARRTGNKYLKYFCDYYEVIQDIGTDEQGMKVLEHAYLQYEENREMQVKVKKSISSSVRDTYVMLVAIPLVIIYQVICNEDYIPFMTTTTIGKAGAAFIFYVILGAIWIINVKLSAPLDTD